MAAITQPTQARGRRAAKRLSDWEIWLTLPVVALLVYPNPLSPWAMLAVPALWLCRWAGRGTITRRTPADIPILVLLLAVPVGLWASADLSRSWPVAYQIVAQVAVFYALVNTVRSAGWLTALAGALVLVTLAVAVLNLTEVFVLGGRLFSARAFLGQGMLGVPKRNIVGGTLAVLLPIPLALTLFGQVSRPVRAGLGLATTVVALSLLAAQTRGAWIGLAVAILVIAIWHNRRFALLVPIAIAGAALVTWYVGPEQIADLILGLGSPNSAQGRWEIWGRGIYMIQDFPFTGAGLGMFTVVGNLLYPLFLATGYPEHVHNVYLQAAIEHGLPGLVAFLALLLLLVYMVVQAARRAQGPVLPALALGLLGSLVVFLTHGLVDTITAYAQAGVIVWGVMGALVALWLHTHEAGERAPGG